MLDFKIENSYLNSFNVKSLYINNMFKVERLNNFNNDHDLIPLYMGLNITDKKLHKVSRTCSLEEIIDILEKAHVLYRQDNKILIRGSFKADHFFPFNYLELITFGETVTDIPSNRVFQLRADYNWGEFVYHFYISNRKYYYDNSFGIGVNNGSNENGSKGVWKVSVIEDNKRRTEDLSEVMYETFLNNYTYLWRMKG